MTLRSLVAAAAVSLLAAAPSRAQQPVPGAPSTPTAAAAIPPAAATTTGATSGAAAGVVLPNDYLIGPDDILSIVYWRDKDMSVDVVVRPDGRITLPLVNDVQAGGLTPDQLRERIRQQSTKFFEDPNVTVVVKQINSRKVFITGLVSKPGAYALSNPTTVLQLLSMAGGLAEFADSKRIVIMRTDSGQEKALSFNYRDVSKGKNLKQNIYLKPGDTVVVP